MKRWRHRTCYSTWVLSICWMETPGKPDPVVIHKQLDASKNRLISLHLCQMHSIGQVIMQFLRRKLLLCAAWLCFLENISGLACERPLRAWMAIFVSVGSHLFTSMIVLLQLFSFPSSLIELCMIEGEQCFFVSDVCSCICGIRSRVCVSKRPPPSVSVHLRLSPVLPARLPPLLETGALVGLAPITWWPLRLFPVSAIWHMLLNEQTPSLSPSTSAPALSFRPLPFSHTFLSTRCRC